MTDKSSAELAVEIDECRDARRTLDQRIRALEKARGEALVRETADHPLAGKKVSRRIKPYSYASLKTIKGVVAQNTSAYALYGKRGHTPKPGEWYVRSESGRTAYPLNSRVIHPGETEWAEA